MDARFLRNTRVWAILLARARRVISAVTLRRIMIAGRSKALRKLSDTWAEKYEIILSAENSAAMTEWTMLL